MPGRHRAIEDPMASKQKSEVEQAAEDFVMSEGRIPTMVKWYVKQLILFGEQVAAKRDAASGDTAAAIERHTEEMFRVGAGPWWRDLAREVWFRDGVGPNAVFATVLVRSSHGLLARVVRVGGGHNLSTKEFPRGAWDEAKKWCDERIAELSIKRRVEGDDV